ncbi:MAG: hypothetical protein WCL44_09270 [bacterium]
MRHTTVCVALLTGLIVACVGPAGSALAQHKAPVKGGAEVEDAAREKSKNLWLKKLTWRGSEAKLRSPEFDFKNIVQNNPKALPEWQVITVMYDTAQEWEDRVVVNYHVLLLKGGGEQAKADSEETPYTLYEGSVSYGDVKKGQNHISTIYVRPNSIERRGPVVAVGVEIVSGGETVSKSEFSTTSKIKADAKDGRWWETVSKSAQVSVRTDGLLKRSETPFALVNYMDEELSQ